MSEQKKSRLPHYLFGSTPSLWRGLRRRYGPVDSPYRSRVAQIQLGIWSLAPERGWESWRFGRAIEQTELHPAPVFIIGYWQSGHSLMHYLMASDPQFATTSLLHCALPSCWATVEPLARWVLRRRSSKTRVVDSLPMSTDGPQGDELAMANLTELSIYHGYSFPRSYEAIFRRAVLLEGVSADELHEWKRCYRRLLQKVAWHTGRSRLLSRNAAHTGRVRQLLELFPNAKFIHLHRNPYRVFAAQEPKWRSLCELWALQTPNIDQLVADTIGLYPVLMKQFFGERTLIPEGQLADVRYEELLANPVSTLRRVYAELDLPEFERLEERLTAPGGTQLGQLAGHDVTLTSEQQELVRREWGFAFEALGYSLDPTQTMELASTPGDD
ncbi:MAG: sulfotransferase [Planctomycetaceae bacterium]|nr:sulfotransferase [Planctomycetaceae bacterium]